MFCQAGRNLGAGRGAVGEGLIGNFGIRKKQKSWENPLLCVSVLGIDIEKLKDMGVQAVELKNSFLLLPRQEQVELMQFFLQVIADSSTVDDVPFELSESLIQELDRREAEVLDGKVKAVSLEEALQAFK